MDEFLTKPCPSKRLLESIDKMDIRVKGDSEEFENGAGWNLPDGTWKVKVAAAPEKGKANRALIEFLAEHLGVAKSRIRITSGETSQLKRIRVDE